MKKVENNNAINEEKNENVDANKKEKKQKKEKKISKIITNTITTILFIIIILEAAIGVINMNRISNGENPVWYLNKKTTETELKTVTEYNLGLYKIVKTDTARETKTTLKPFFIGE